MSDALVTETALHGGRHLVIRHNSSATQTRMELAVFIPPGEGPFPCLFYLSGLTCTWENAATKAGAQFHAAKHGMVLVFPDTSPRGPTVADDEEFSLGQGAGYYMTATEAPWAEHYQMEDYVIKELPDLVAEHAPIARHRLGVTGHSMGGYGALGLAMKNPDLFQSVSAFAPISAMTATPWGQRALDEYRGGKDGERYDVCQLMASHGWGKDMLVDQGAADPFKDEHLMPERLAAAAEVAGIDLTLRLQPGYDHSYWFVSSFMGDHIRWHADRLKP
jgi:S-formylglutathione hydrolase